LRGNILVVEKDPFYSSLYQKTLTQEGYQVFLAEGIDEGKTLFGERKYDVVISDMVVRGEDAITLLKSIREASPRQDVIMITSMQSIRKAVEALKFGASDYLTKPVDPDELLLLIRNLIDRQNISAEHSRLVNENVLFFEQFRVQKRGLEVLAMLDADRILNHFLDMVIEETGARGAAVWLYSEVDNIFDFAAARGSYDSALEESDRSFQVDFLRSELFRGRAILEDKRGKQHGENKLERIRRFRLPLIFSEKITGLLAVTPRRDDNPFNGFQVNVARVLAESAAIALKNAEFFSLEASRDLRDPHIETYSPAYFHQAGIKEVHIARRYGRSLSVVCVEINNFKELKKKIKESQARQLLKQFAEKLLEVSRETDVLSMMEEGFYALVVPETDFYGALMLIKRVKIALRAAVYSIDLKREIGLDFSLGSATYPNGGEQLITLLRSAKERLKEDRESLVKTLKIESRSFWKAYAHFLGMKSGKARKSLLANAFLSLSQQEVDTIRNLFLDEVGRLGERRGLIYIGNQTIDSAFFDYSGFARLANTRMSIFTLGTRGKGSWNHPEIMPVYLDDRDIGAHRFLLCIAESFYYTFLCRQDGPGRWEVFHSADPYITQEMTTKLQERYQLQQRIG
jgi:diguanylate cyclase (GGDEF)-like protein